jgi:hypothetical protein
MKELDLESDSYGVEMSRLVKRFGDRTAVNRWTCGSRLGRRLAHQNPRRLTPARERW